MDYWSTARTNNLPTHRAAHPQTRAPQHAQLVIVAHSVLKKQQGPPARPAQRAHSLTRLAQTSAKCVLLAHSVRSRRLFVRCAPKEVIRMWQEAVSVSCVNQGPTVARRVGHFTISIAIHCLNFGIVNLLLQQTRGRIGNAEC